ncbi:MAG: CBS domain-containing protein [Planctomycetes bacterium]|nr:CBS domain-containing protein [Planctomycetota bacterium]
MNQPVLARDIMVTRLVTLSPDMDAFEAINLLLRHEISGAPVVDAAGNLLGVFSEKDCMSVLVEGAYQQLPSTRVSAFMGSALRTIDEDADLLSIAQIFLNTSYRRLPVVRGARLVGQISRRDVLRAAMKLTERHPDRETALLYLSSLVDRAEAPIQQ